MCCKANLAVVIDHYSSTSFLPRKNFSFRLFPLLGLHLRLLLLLQNGIDDRNTSILTFNMQYSSAALSTLLIYKTEKFIFVRFSITDQIVNRMQPTITDNNEQIKKVLLTATD